MKFGLRTPSLKKMIKARSTSKWKRQIKKAVIPGYGKKGIGLFRNPKKSLYNKVYRKTSFDIFKLLGLKWCLIKIKNTTLSILADGVWWVQNSP